MNQLDKIRVVYLDADQQRHYSFQSTINAIPDFEYVAGFSNPDNGVEFILNSPSGFLVFSDIDLPGNDGLRIAEQLRSSGNGLVLLSGQPQHAIQAFETCALDFLLRPVTIDKLAATLSTLRKKQQTMDIIFTGKATGTANTTAPKERPKRLFVSMSDKIEVLPVDEIISITATSSYSRFMLHDGQEIVSSKSIKNYEELLGNHPDFLRIHKSHIINKRFLKTVSKKHRTYRAIMANKEEFEISYQRKDEIMYLLLC